MANLTETAFYTRKTINWMILSVIGYIILRLSWSILVALWLYFFPPQPPPPNHAFGKLPAIKFPPQASSSGQLTFRLETIEGTVPTASNSAAVYFMPKNAANLLGLPKAEEFATKVEFTGAPIQETKNVYRFEDPSTILRQMRYDIISKNFIIRYLFEQDTSIFTERNIPLSSEAIEDSKNFLQNYGLLPEDFVDGDIKVQYLRFVGDKLVTTTSHSQADSIRIDFFRNRMNNVPVFTPNPDEGLINFIYSGSTINKKRVLQIAYTYWPVDFGTTGTYEVKTSSTAWQELQNGNGYIARSPKNGITNVTVRRVYLGYYDSIEPQTYIQPVFVFEGDDGFLAYVPAIAPPWTE